MDDMSVRRLPMLVMLLAVIQICFAQAQTAMTEQKTSPIKVLGFYSLSAASDQYARFIRETIAFHDPANFSEEQKALFRRLGRGDALEPFTDEDRKDWEDHLRHHMTDAAVFEVLVTNSDATFDIGEFVQPDPSQSKDFWQVAWNEKFLTPDGEEVLLVPRGRKLPEVEQFRVVFVIHFWKANLPLRSSYGELPLPVMQPLPDRLWRLTPYELPS
jgi:hypothetical protein